MISAVRNVSFGESAQDLINAEGKYNAQPKIEDMPADSFESKKSNKAAAAAGIGALALLAAAAGLGYAVHNDKFAKVAAEEIKDMKLGSKIWAYTKNAGHYVGEKADALYKWCASFFKSAEAAGDKAA